MAGTREGGLKAAATIKRTRGAGFYTRIGRKGGEAQVTKGFGTNRTIASLAGSKGGRVKPSERRIKRQRITVQFQ